MSRQYSAPVPTIVLTPARWSPPCATARRSRSAAIRITRSLAADCASKSTATKIVSTARIASCFR